MICAYGQNAVSHAADIDMSSMHISIMGIKNVLSLRQGKHMRI